LKKANLHGAVIVTTPQEVSLSDVRKEINFCKKTKTRVLGVIENMSGFVCPACQCQSQIFPPVTGGATKMCQDMDVPLMAQVPLEPNLLIQSEKGKCYMTEAPDSVTAQRLKEIVGKIVNS